MNNFSSAEKIADYIVGKCVKNKTFINFHMLQYILFFIQCNFIKNFNILAFSDSIKAYNYGPGIKGLKKKYKNIEYYFNDNIIYFPQRKESEILFTKLSYKTVIDIIIETCIEIGEKELKNRLTKTGTPWYINYSTFSHGCSKANKIPIKEIINYMERDFK